MTETATAKVELDGQQAENQLKELQAKAKALGKELREMKMAKDPNYEAKKREFEQLDAKIKGARKSIFDLNNLMKDLSGASLKDLTRAQRTLNSELRNMNRATDEGKRAFAEKTKQLQQVHAEIAKVNTQMKGYNSQGGLTQKTLGSLKMGYLALAGAVTGAFAGISGFMNDWDKRKKSNEELLFALRGQESVTRRLIALSGELQGKVGIDDDALKQQMIFLAMQGRTEAQIRNTILAAVELSKVTGQGLDSSIKKLDETFEGNRGELAKLDSGFKDLTEEQLRNGAAVDLVLHKYGGLAAKSFEEGLGPLHRFQNAWGDLGKSIGGLFAAVLMPVFRDLAGIFDKINGAVERWGTTSTQRFSDQVQKVGELENSIRPLLSRYDELTSKSDLSTQEQTELNGIIDTIGKTIPTAVSQFDAYGDAIAINTSRAREFIDTEKDRLIVVNKAAIDEAENQLKIAQINVDASDTRMKQIEREGTFTVTELQNWGGRTQQIRRNATEQEVQEQIDKNKRMLSIRNGWQAELERLKGDALGKEIEQRRVEAEEARKLEEKKIQYKSKSVDELKQLAAQGDQLAIDMMANMKKQTEITRTAYVQLSQAITQTKEDLAGFSAEGDLLKAQQAGASLQMLESLKAVIDKIIQAGGSWEAFMNKLRDEEFVQIMQRNEAAAAQAFDQLNEDIKNDLNAALDSALDENSLQLSGFAKIETDSNELFKEFAKNWESFAQIGADAAFTIIRNNQQAMLQSQLDNLQKQKESELSNKNLTEAQRAKIEEKYRKQEAKIKAEAFKKQMAADIIQATINTALAVSKALASALPPANFVAAALAGAAGAAQIAVIASQKVPQFAKGRYNVIGAEDGRRYNNVPFLGKAQTGIYERTALISERGPELIVDAATTKNIRINYPGIMTAINAARVPQYAGGKYAEPVSPSSQAMPSSNKETQDAILRLHASISTLNQRLQHGIEATLDYQNFRRFEDKVNDTENKYNI